MKKYNIVLGLLLSGTIISSCSSSFLELYPETAQSSGTFYRTADQFDQAMNAAYTGLRYIASDGLFMDEMRSDNAFYTYYYGDRGPFNAYEKPCLFIDDEVSANAGPILERWQVDYQNIAKTNTVLDRIEASEMTNVEKSSYRAEALFLRAFYYFDLVKCFGGVPLTLNEVTGTDGVFTARASVEECYTQILADLNEAISIGLPIPARFPDENGGRATMGAARMLRAEVNMTKSSPDYATAESDLKAITQMNYELLNDYAECFNPTNKNNRESILEVQYTEDGASEQYSTIAFRMIPKCSNVVDMMGIAGSNYAGGGTVTGTSGGWVVPTKHMVDSYEDGDLRLFASIVVAEGTSSGDSFTFEQIVDDVRNYVCPAGKDFRYMVKKYYHPPYKYTMRGVENFPVYRYSGALLLLAECLVQEGKSAEALPYINKVRARAGLANLTTCTLEDVSNEQKHELAFENHRWSDLKRQGLAKSVMTNYGQWMKANFAWVAALNNGTCFNIENFRMIYAIPTRELEINPQLTQNPGY
ncbi:RagB/SusD family nutrient uptake outer membrane protein [Phocaeicola oris]|uniref:RagB/SusD family nutrient uptake outer membrane protein n=1 Tax=Phocaeicola oris TaxID=2896850 RepID=UPI00234F0DB6|nr:RagB/SusD family nutrient uptake outer membrane protein [Phocaeicola oris]MCE2616015.1 RagB/SusD family nutrient uptake outer membrane protein [Phocaeicola oris]